MKQITTIGLDLAKQAFQVHGAEADGRPAVSRKLRRTEVLGFFREAVACLVGMEACEGAYFFGAREIAKLGHDVRLNPPPKLLSCLRNYTALPGNRSV
jgi:transposase